MSALQPVLVATALGFLTVGLVEGDLMPHPEPVFIVTYSADELAAEVAARESLNRLAEFMPSLCRDVWVGQGIVRVQREEARKGKTVPVVCAP